MVEKLFTGVSTVQLFYRSNWKVIIYVTVLRAYGADFAPNIWPTDFSITD